MIRIGFALAAVAATAALLPLVSAPGQSGEPASVGLVAQVAAPEPVLRSPDTVALESCIAQKGARTAAKCVGHLADSCLKAAGGAGAEAECYRRESEAWSALLEDYRRKLEKRLVTDPKRLVELRDGQRAWLAERAQRCDVPAPADAAACAMRESGRRVIQLRLIADQAGATL
jgi:uncharacterized protein YecT (DUF1311 family)